MSFDPSRLGVTDPSTSLQLRFSRSFSTLAAALQDARSDRGDELIVEYLDEEAQTVRFAVIDIQGNDEFDLSLLRGRDGVALRSILRSHEVTRLVDEASESLNFITDFSFPDQDLAHVISSTLALAQAVCSPERHGDGLSVTDPAKLLVQLNDTLTLVTRRLEALAGRLGAPGEPLAGSDDVAIISEQGLLRARIGALRHFHDLAAAQVADRGDEAQQAPPISGG